LLAFIIGMGVWLVILDARPPRRNVAAVTDSPALEIAKTRDAKGAITKDQV
jgi:hypothetical protein